jgi:hypothetical protein
MLTIMILPFHQSNPLRTQNCKPLNCKILHFDNFTIETTFNKGIYLESVVADLTWWQVSIAVLILVRQR